MTKAQATNTSSVAKHSKRSSLIARCTAPFVAKQRSQVEQEIRLDEPFRQYAPGDSVKGAVHLTFAKPIRITHLVIRLHGFVKVFSRAKLPGEEILYDESLLSPDNGRGRRGTEYFGNGYARLFEDEEVLCGEGRVIGQYAFRFEVVLPSKNTPSSIDVCNQILRQITLNLGDELTGIFVVRTWNHIISHHLDCDAPNSYCTDFSAAFQTPCPGDHRYCTNTETQASGFDDGNLSQEGKAQIRRREEDCDTKE